MSTHDWGSGGVADLLRVLLESAEAFLARGAADDARRCAEQALQQAAGGELHGRALRTLGRAYAAGGDRSSAERFLRESVELHVARSDHLGAAETLADLGETLRLEGRLESARDALTESLRCSASLRPGPLRARTLEELGTVQRLLGETPASVETLSEAKRLRETQRDPLALARACRSLGNALFHAGRWEESLAEHEHSLRLVETAGDRPETATALNNVGSALIQLGRNKEAETAFRRARSIFEELGHASMVAYVVNNLGLLASYRGDAVEAERLLREALEIREQFGYLPGQSKSLNNLANVALMAGRPEDAVVYAERSIAILEGLGRTEGLAPAWFARGRACLELARSGEAERAAEKLEELAITTESRETECDALLLRAELALSRDERETALDTAIQARDLAAAAELSRHSAEAARLSGEARMALGAESEAREDLLLAEKAFLELQSQHYLALARLSLARLFLRAGAHEAAARRLRAAVEASQRMGHTQIQWRGLLLLAEAEWSLSRRQARSTLARAESLARQLGRADLVEQAEALRDELAAGRGSGPHPLVGEAGAAMARALRTVAEPGQAIQAVLRTLHDLLDVDEARFLPEAGFPSREGRLVPVSHPPSDSGGEASPPEALSLPVLGNQDLVWGRLSLVSTEAREDDQARFGPLLQSGADLLGLALDGLAIGAAGDGGSARDGLGSDGSVAGGPIFHSLGTERTSRYPPASGSEASTVRREHEDPARARDPQPPESGSSGARSGLIGQSPRFLALLATVDRVAKSDSSVLILGESGTGKELIARTLHEKSARAGRGFEAIACPSIPRDLIEAELFGHEKGAFTGADRERRGRIELAEGGTLFLDEIGDIDLATQSKLLRFLQEREFSRVGGRETLRVDVRIVAATSRDLDAEIREGRFREDLYYRLSVVPLSVPPLRERGDDVLSIANHLLTELGARAGRTLVLAAATQDLLRRYPWPGNVRELRNLVEYLVAVCPGGRVGPGDLPERIRETSSRRPTEAGLLRPGETLDARLMTLEGQLIRQALDAADGNQSGAARLLGITESKLRHRMRRYGLGGERTAGSARRRTKRTRRPRNAERGETA